MFRLMLALGVSFALLPDLDEKKDIIAPIIEEPIVEAPSVSSYDTLSAINSIIQDVGRFCDRNEETCITGNALISKAHGAAQTSIKNLIKATEKDHKLDISAANTASTQ